MNHLIHMDNFKWSGGISHMVSWLPMASVLVCRQVPNFQPTAVKNFACLGINGSPGSSITFHHESYEPNW